MKLIKHKFLLLLLLPALSTNAQTIEVVNFRHETTDLRARRNPVKDINDQNCALLIVTTWNDEVKFSDNSVFRVEKKSGEHWIWLSGGARRLIISSLGYTTLYYDFLNPLKGEEVYIMTLRMPRLKDESASKLYNLTFILNSPDVLISKDQQAGIQVMGSTARYKLAAGRHSFQFAKQGFSDFKAEYNIMADTTISISLEAGETTSEFQPPSIISVNTTPSGAMVYANDQFIGQTPLQRMLIPGDYNLSMSKDLYLDHTSRVNLESGVPLDLGTIVLQASAGTLTIESNPSGAEVKINNRDLGRTPLLEYQISSGNHQLELVLPDYLPWKEEISLEKGEVKSINANLIPAFGELIINTQPIDGLTLLINGKIEGNTPFRHTKMPTGTYEIEVRDDKNHWKGIPLWLGAKENVNVTGGKTTERTIALVQNHGELSVKAEGSDIFIGNERVGSLHVILNLPPSTYSIIAKRNKHNDATQTINLANAEKKNIELNPRPMLGSVSVIANPFDARGASIEINGNPVKEKTPAVIPLLIGNYSISVTHPHFYPASQNVTINKEGEQKEIIFNLESTLGIYSKKERNWKISKYASLATSLAVGASGFIFHQKADNTYAKYQTANSSEDAKALREDVIFFDRVSCISFGVSVVPSYMFFHSWLKQRKYKKTIVKY
jgi:hypothetical protein